MATPLLCTFPRRTPYTIRHKNRRVKWHNEDHIQRAVWRNRKPLEREVGDNTKDGTPGSWFKITIPYGRKYDKTWLMNSIQSHCSVPFTPVDFHYVKDWARFFVQDAGPASALRDVSYKICGVENQKISIIVDPSAEPYSVQNKLEPEEMEQLKGNLAMSKRYDVSQQALDLQTLRFDPDLVDHDIDIILNRRSCMAATLQIIETNFPKLLSLNLCNNKLYRLDGLSDIIQKAPTIKILNLSKNELNSTWEVGKMKGLKLEELWLEGNPLCNTFRDQSTYIRSDGQELPSPIIVDIDIPYLIKPCKVRKKGKTTMRNRLSSLLPHRYYFIYDSGDRRGLLGAYHDEAYFSLSIPFNPEDSARSSLCEYVKDNRNIKKLKDPYLRVQLLKHTKHDIVLSLCVLPRTQHDFSSFLVDMWYQTERVLCFSVNGVFKEGKSRPISSLGAHFSSSLCIVNDQLFLRDTTPNETQSPFFMPVPTPTSRSMPTVSQEQQEMVQSFSTQSGMNLEWSQKCLQDNEWNYTRAGQAFTTLKVRSWESSGFKAGCFWAFRKARMVEPSGLGMKLRELALLTS
uniref:TAP-C domain-containing protein n=1 Tax=Equus asinus TaxID=9793 RepID=A0A9L0JVU6_EQUAS